MLFRQLGFPNSQQVERINEEAKALNDAKRARMEAEAQSVQSETDTWTILTNGQEMRWSLSLQGMLDK